MKGLTQTLRDLAQGEQTTIGQTSRDNIYQIAKRVGIKVKVEKMLTGFYVTNISGQAVKVPVVQDAMSAFIAMAREKKGLPPVIESEDIDTNERDWTGWSGEMVERSNGEKTTFRLHYKTQRKEIISKESDWDSFA